MNDSHLIETPLASELIYDGKIVHLYKDTVALPNGQPALREVIRHVGAVCVVPLTVKNGSDITLLEFNDVFMLRVENKQVKVYAENKEYLIRKPLYQVEESLSGDFVRISKTTIVNLKKIKRVAPSLKGMMFIELKNGLKDNISRKYLPDFKNALDL